MSENGNPRDMLLPWTNEKLNNYGYWELFDKNGHFVAEVSFNFAEDDTCGEKHHMDFIVDACNDTQQIKEARKQAFLEAAELAMKGSLVWANETELAAMLREKADEEAV